MEEREEEGGIPDEVREQWEAEQRRSRSEYDRTSRKPLSGYPYNLFGESVNGPIRDFLFKEVDLSKAKSSGKKTSTDSE